MSISKLKLLSGLEKIASLKTQEEWDNSGLNIDSGKESFEKILVALDVDKLSLQEAIDVKADFMVVHHPLFFNPVTSIREADPTGRLILELIKNDISLYALHTPFDKLVNNTDWTQAQGIGLKDIENLTENNFGVKHFGLTGVYSDNVTLKDVIYKLSEAMDIEPSKIRAAGDFDSSIKKVAIVSGAGSDFILDAKLKGCDLLITGDIKYHEACYGRDLGICLLDPGHFNLEKAFVDLMVERLSILAGEEAVILSSRVQKDPFNIL